MSKWMGAAAWSGKEARAGDRLPYGHHLDATTIVLRDGSLMRSFWLSGHPFESEDDALLDQLAAVRNTVLRSAIDSRVVLYHHVIRRRVRLEPTGGVPMAPFCAGVDQHWNERLNERLFLNDQYLTLVIRPARGKAGLGERLLRFGRSSSLRYDPSSRATLDTATASLSAALQPYGLKILSVYEHQGQTYSEPLEFLSMLYNGEQQPVLLPTPGTDLGHHLPYRRVSFGLDAIEVHGAGRSFASLLGVKQYPDATRAGLFDNLLRAPLELVITETFAPVERQTARERIDLALRRLRSADENATTERAEMLAARDAVGAGQLGFGDHHVSVLVRAGDLDRLDEATATAAAALSDIGAIAVREDVNLEPGFWAQFPGNEQYAVRRALISSANAAGFISLHGFSQGGPDGSPWGGPVSVLETTAGTPFFFNFHESDLGNFTVIGPSGSGKTVVLNFLAAQAQRFAPRTILFDKDRGSEIFVRAAGGRYERLARGRRTGFNPLRLSDTSANRAFLRDWLAILLVPADQDETAIIAGAVDEIFAHGPGLRRLRHLKDLIAGGRRPQAGDLRSRLAPWVEGGECAWLFDNDDDQLDISQRLIGFDMTELLEDRRLRTPTLMYLFHRIEQRLDGSPTIILIDEGWKALDDPVFSDRIRDWMKTLRKRNAILGFGTQSPSDALQSAIASAIVEQTGTAIFMPNPKAHEEDYRRGFGLTAYEYEIVRSLPAASRCFLVKQGHRSAVVRLDLNGMSDLLVILSGREESVRRLDAIRASVGDQPARWYPALTGCAWPGEEVPTCWAEAAE